MSGDVISVSTTDTKEQMDEASARYKAKKTGEEPPADPTPADEPQADPKAETPAETPKVEEPAAETPAKDAPAKDGKPKPAEPVEAKKRKSKLQREIDEAVWRKNNELRLAEDAERRREAAERAAEAAERRAAEARGEKAPPETPAPAADDALPPEPKIEDFDNDYDKWDRAWRTWSVQSRDAAIAAQVRQTSERARAEEAGRLAYQQDVNQFVASMDAARDRHADFEEVTEKSANLLVTPHMEERFLKSPVGGELVYHLCQHPDECERLASLPPRDSVYQLGKLEAALESAVGTAPTPATDPPSPTSPRGPVPPAPVVTRAQAPIQPLEPGPSATQVPLEDLNEYQSYKQRRLAQIQGRR